MAKAGKTGTITTKTASTEKDFAGSGVEGQKKPDADVQTVPFCFSVLNGTEAWDTGPGNGDRPEQPSELQSIITCADIVASLRAKGHRI